MRDRDGITQVTFDPQSDVLALAQTLRHEDVVRVRGTVRKRPAGTENSRLVTGEVELRAQELHIYSRSATPPFPVSGDEPIDEHLRMLYRYVDLRRSRLQRNLAIRHKIVKAMRDFFDARDFLEIETPSLIKSTPEGARDYLVPSRLHAGAFYALPQSPQLLKQILMIAGFGRYMQIARCFRDEDLRADRQPEFTQLDVEMSFCTQEMIMQLMEACMRYVWEAALGIALPVSFVRLTHAQALQQFGTDKPDLRFKLELADVKHIFMGSEFLTFRTLAKSESGAILVLRYPGGGALSRREFDALSEVAKLHGAKGMAWIALAADGFKSSIARFLDAASVDALRRATSAQDGDALLLFADSRDAALAAAGRMRNEVAERAGLRSPQTFAFAWVTDFPLFEREEESGAVISSHHPFTAPVDDQWNLLERDPLRMRAQHYDLVLNGFELGSGSMRIHNPELQRKVFRLLGLSDEQIHERFGYFLNALDYGAPPHGGMALGVDRIVMLAVGETNIRDVIAFPKNQMAKDVMMDAPAPVGENLLRDLHLRTTVTPER